MRDGNVAGDIRAIDANQSHGSLAPSPTQPQNDASSSKTLHGGLCGNWRGRDGKIVSSRQHQSFNPLPGELEEHSLAIPTQ